MARRAPHTTSEEQPARHRADIGDLLQGLLPDDRPDPARRLLTAAASCFAERGYHATTTRDIASRAGMSPAAVYIHYPSKEELFYQISRVGHDAALATVRQAATGTDDPVERLRAVVREFTLWHARRPTLARTIQYELAALTPEHFAAIADTRRETDRVVREAIQAGVASGDFDVADIPGTALAILALGIDIARWFQPGGPRTPESLADFYAELALRMVRAS